MSALRRWTVRSDPVGCGWYCWFYVFIYETNDELRKAATKYSSYHDYDHFTDTLACFQPIFTVRYNNHKPVSCAKTAFIGVMRFSMEAFKPHIIIHEAAHAAVHYVCSLNLETEYKLGDDIKNEEALCYAVHEFSMAILRKAEMI